MGIYKDVCCNTVYNTKKKKEREGKKQKKQERGNECPLLV